MSQEPVQWAVIVRKGRTERLTFTLLPIFMTLFFGLIAWDLRNNIEDPSSLLALPVLALAFLIPVAFYMWHWRIVLDGDGMHRRRLFVWEHHGWGEVTKITKSTDGRGNEQLWVYFTEDEPWYFLSRYYGYYPARMLMQKHQSIELRDKNT